MCGFTTTLTGVGFDQALEKTVAAPKAGVVVVGFLGPQVMVGLVGHADIQAVADAAQQRLRRACTSLGASAPRAT